MAGYGVVSAQDIAARAKTVDGTPDWAKMPSLLKPGEVAAIFRVDPKTVTRWAANGKIQAIKTAGNHRRFRLAEIRALYERGQ